MSYTKKDMYRDMGESVARALDAGYRPDSLRWERDHTNWRSLGRDRADWCLYGQWRDSTEEVLTHRVLISEDDPTHSKAFSCPENKALEVTINDLLRRVRDLEDASGR